MSELAGKLIEALAAMRDTFLFFTVLDAWENGIVLRLGKPVRDVGPGLRWHWPFHIERVVTTSVAWEATKLEVQSLTSADDKELGVRAVVTYRVKDARKFLIEVGGEDSVLEDTSPGVIREIVANHTLTLLRDPALDKKLTAAVRKEAWQWGIEVKRVRLTDLTTAKVYRILGTGTVFEREEE